MEDRRTVGLLAFPILVIAAIALVLFYSAHYRVTEWEQAVITQFGEIRGEPVTAAGLYFKKPFIQQVHRFERRLVRWDGTKTTTYTKDRRTVTVDVTARWRIDDARKFLETVGSTDGADSRLNGIIEGAVKDEIAKFDLFEVVRSTNRILEKEEQDITAALVQTAEAKIDVEEIASLGRGAQPRLRQDAEGQYQVGRPAVLSGILVEARKRLRQIGLGIHLEDVLIKELNYTRDIETNVYQQMIAELEKIAAGFRSHGRQNAERKLGEMERELATIRSEAARRAETIKGEGDAEAIRIYADAYNRDPDFYRFLRTLQTYEKVLGANSTIVIGTDSPLYTLFKDLLQPAPASKPSSGRAGAAPPAP